MTTLTAPPTHAEDPAEVAGPAPVGAALRFELAKLFSQWRIRLVLLACLLAPGIFVAGVSGQSSLPSDTVFGRWMHATGWAGSLVVLSFCCSYALPLLVSVVAGDVFAAEDRLGTWRHLLMAVRSPRRIFAVKALAALTAMLAIAIALAVSSIVGGLSASGAHPLVGLDGHLLSGGDAAARVVLAWLSVLAPTLAFAGVGLLGSVLLGRSPTGLIVPAVVALGMDLAGTLPLPVVVRLALPSNAFLAWRGLFTAPVQTGPLLLGLVVSLVWAAVATGLAYALFLRRDFADLAHDGAGRRALAMGIAPLAALVAVTILIVAVATPASGSGIDRSKLQRSLATVFGHLYRLQSQDARRTDVTEARLGTSARCVKGGRLGDDTGAGNDWRCVVRWHIPGATGQGSAVYQLDVTPDGRYVADGDGPKAVNGFFTIRTARGVVPNPLWQFDGTVDLLRPLSKE
jgi:ABC-2 type transport system permease protein